MLQANKKAAPLAFNWHPHAAIRRWQAEAVSNDVTSEVSRHIDDVLFIADSPSFTALEHLRDNMIEVNEASNQNSAREFCVVPFMAIKTFEPTQVHVGLSSINDDLNDQSIEAHYFQCMSSGSDGKPKRVRRTHASWITSFEQNAARANITDNDSYAIIGSLSHSLALYAALEAANIGADIHALSELRPDHQARALQQLATTVLYATPTQLRLIAKQVERLNISDFKLRYIFSGGGKLDQHTASMISEVFPNTVVQEFYGATETSFITISDAQTPAGSVGKAYPGVELRIDRTKLDSHPDLLQGDQTSGEILVKSPYLFQGYVGPTDNAAQWHDGFINLGEIGYINDNGYLFLVGRESRRVNIADQLVYPEEIENIINENPSVRACAVLAIPDKERGHVLAAVIEADNVNDLQQALLIEIRQRVGSLKAPRKLVRVDQLPLLASGKPDLLAAASLLSRS